ELRADISVCSAPVLDDDVLPQDRTQLVDQRTRDRIAAAPSRKWHDELDRLGRIGLCGYWRDGKQCRSRDDRCKCRSHCRAPRVAGLMRLPDLGRIVLGLSRAPRRESFACYRSPSQIRELGPAWFIV